MPSPMTPTVRHIPTTPLAAIRCPDRPRALHMQFVTHACMKFSGRFGTLLVDPWFLNEPIANYVCWKFPRAVIPPEEVVRDVDWVYITHCHEDHFHLPSIALFPRDQAFLLPEYDHHPGLRAQTRERTLRKMGFWNIRKLRSWETLDLGDGAQLTIVPAAQARYYEWENSGIVLEYAGTTIIDMNDNITDVALCEEIRERFPGGFDLGLIQAAGTSMYPGCFRMSLEEKRSETAKRHVAMADQRRMVELIGPRAIAPIAGDFAWFAPRYFHNNWASRGTPLLFQRLLEDYPDKEMDLFVFHPSDEWTLEGGFVQNHPTVDWQDYLPIIERQASLFESKVAQLESWLDTVETTALESRSRAFTDRVQKMVTRELIDFAARFRQVVEGPDAGFSFVLKADPERGFSIDWDDDGDVDQTLYVPQREWAAVLDAKMLWTDIQWNGEANQHVEYRYDIARFWYWIEYYIAINTKQPQVLMEPALYPQADALDLTKGLTPMEGEWDDVFAAYRRPGEAR
ncbi:MAG TPA: hypothetical protein DFR83_23060 [Deltaproteobacteria bacterium]|nr:hypothetical protein [Deltaproteobacteria bacterium]